MKLFRYLKDGGAASHVAGWFIIEIKNLFSIVLLHFSTGSREAYHTHAFDAVSWVLRGELIEHMIDGSVNVYTPSLRPVVTWRSTFHKVYSVGDSWALSFRGSWSRTWREYLPTEDTFVTLTHGRRVVEAGA